MSTFLHLLRKEACDVRWHVRGGLAALTALTFLFAWFASDSEPDAYLTVVAMAVFWSVPSGALLAGAAVAAELFAGECATRRVDATALLPVPLSQVFRAKCAMVAIAWLLGGLTMSVAAPVAAVAFGPGQTAHAVAAAVQNGAVAALLVVPFVASVVVLACVLEHGLGSVLAGLALPAMLAGAGAWLGRWDDWGVAPGAELALGLAVAATAALVWGAWLAFTRGPIHLGVRLRRFALGVGAGFGAIVVSGVAAAAAVDARVDLAPGDADAIVDALRVSPDGEFAVVFVTNVRTNATSQAWSVRLADGSAVRLPGRHLTMWNWGAPGSVRLMGTDDASPGEAREIDLATGALLPRIDAGVPSEPWAPCAAWNDRWARIVERDGQVTVTWRDRGISRTAAGGIVSVSPVEGLVLVGARGTVLDLAAGREIDIGGESGGVMWGSHQWMDGGRILTYVCGGRRRILDCDAWEVRDVVIEDGTWSQVGDGVFAVTRRASGASALLDVRTGAVVPVGSPVLAVPGVRRHMAVSSGNGYELIDCATGRVLPPIPEIRWSLGMNRVQDLPDGNLLVCDVQGPLRVVAPDGTTVRRIDVR